ncbi:MAG: hypothetical protein Q9213_001932 [Squamulea squamosa]
MAVVPLLPRPAVSTAIDATTTPNAAKGVAHPRTPNVAAQVIAILGNIAAVTTEFKNEGSGSSGSGNSRGEKAPKPEPLPESSTSVPDTSISSFSTSDYTSLPSATIPSLQPIPTYGGGGAGGGAPAITSFTFATITASSTVGAVLSTFTTTVTIYYYTLFITTTTFILTETSYVTSSFTSTRKRVTALATDVAEADDIFESLEQSILLAPTLSVSGSGVADFSETRQIQATSTARSGGSQVTGGAGVAGGGELAMSAGDRAMERWAWGLWLWGLVGIGVGVGMVLL